METLVKGSVLRDRYHPYKFYRITEVLYGFKRYRYVVHIDYDTIMYDHLGEFPGEQLECTMDAFNREELELLNWFDQPSMVLAASIKPFQG